MGEMEGAFWGFLEGTLLAIKKIPDGFWEAVGGGLWCA